MESSGNGGTAGPDGPQTFQDSTPPTRCVSPPASVPSSSASQASAVQVSHEPQSEDMPQTYGKDDELHAKIHFGIDKCRQSLHNGMREAIANTETFSHQVVYGSDPARLFTWIGLVKDTQAPTQVRRLSAMLTRTTYELSQLADTELANFSSAVFPAIEELEKRWIDRLECKERDMRSECRKLLQMQETTFQKDLEDLKAIHALCEDEQKALKENNAQQEKTLAELKDQYEKALADDKRRHDQELLDLRAKFEKEAAVRDAQCLSDVSAANNKTSDEMALRQKAEAELASSCAKSLKVREDLEGAQARLRDALKKKEANDELRRKENERREVEARQREQRRHRREEEARRKEAEMCARHQTQMDTKQGWLDRAMEEVGGLKVALKKETVLALQKDVVNAERIKKADDAERRNLDQKWEKEAKQHEQDRLRREVEITKKESELRASHRLQLNAKQEELDRAMKQIGDLEANLKEETRESMELLEDSLSYEVRVRKMSADLVTARSGRKEAEVKQQTAEDQRKAIEERLRAAEEKQNAAKQKLVIAEQQREAAERLQQNAQAEHRHMQKEMLSAQFHRVIAVAELNLLKMKADEEKDVHGRERAANQATITMLRRQLEESTQYGTGAAVYRRMHDVLWAYILGSPLKFSMIAWPVMNGARSLGDLAPSAIQTFVLDSRYAGGRSDTVRVREAIRMWHPDKFGQRLASRASEDDRGLIKKGVEAVSQALNGMLAELGKSSTCRGMTACAHSSGAHASNPQKSAPANASSHPSIPRHCQVSTTNFNKTLPDASNAMAYMDEFGRWDMPRYQASLTLIPETNRRGFRLKFRAMAKGVTAVNRLRAPLRSLYYRAKMIGRGARLEARNEELRMQNEQLRAENEQLRAENEQLRAENEERRMENEGLRTENEELRTDNEGLTARIEELAARVEGLERAARRRSADLYLVNAQLQLAEFMKSVGKP
ncbi:hypothetical protein EVG20_g4227 [Dentipellis fragilis]|uniref:J domain-containing protein n=1 Tax=Dentipellis fragilis TaxID=205917 RepID=A0A4Y9YYM3_9AGAM|nr:hypothetical protein EVG20_g4227 [Dentipellis fragilis]